MLIYGKVTDIAPPRVSVKITGIEDDAVLSCMVLQLGGQTENIRIWIAPRVGDIVAVLYDPNLPENSLILGGVYPDGASVPEGSGIAIQADGGKIDMSGDLTVKANAIRAGKDHNNLHKAARSDRVDSELTDIMMALDNIVSAFNTHMHTCAAVGSNSTVPTTKMFNTYNAGTSECDSVAIN